MSKHLSLEICKELKAAGYPQEPPTDGAANNQWCICFTGDSPHLEINCNFGEHYTCPPLITADGMGGVFPWLREKLPTFYYQIQPLGIDYYLDSLQPWQHAASPEATIVACLEHMKAATT